MIAVRIILWMIALPIFILLWPLVLVVCGTYGIYAVVIDAGGRSNRSVLLISVLAIIIGCLIERYYFIHAWHLLTQFRW